MQTNTEDYLNSLNYDRKKNAYLSDPVGLQSINSVKTSIQHFKILIHIDIIKITIRINPWGRERELTVSMDGDIFWRFGIDIKAGSGDPHLVHIEVLCWP